MNVFSIPASESFVDILASRLLHEISDPIAMRKYIVLLPNRRACRSFLKSLSRGQMVFEPLVFPFGDIDLAQIASELGVNKTIISETKRQAILMQLLSQHKGQTKQIAILADKLASLIDQANWEEVPLATIASIVPQDLAAHWEVVLDFLKVV
jgi:ATP-dependent helicase/nuclease subunit B